MLPFTPLSLSLSSSLNLSLILSIALLCLYMMYKLKKVHVLVHELADHQGRDSAVLFRQLEALQGLYAELGLEKSLPGTRGWAASPDFLMELVRHARAARPGIVVECGSGTSTLVLARCIEMNGQGRVYSLEHDHAYAEQTRALLRRHGLERWAVVLDAPLTARSLAGGDWSWYATGALDTELAATRGAGAGADSAAIDMIDMLVIDGPPKDTGTLARYPAGPLLFPQLAIGAAVFLDDAARPDETAILARWQTEFPQFEQSSRACEKGCAVLIRRR
jgi:hypothetical protein